VSKGETAKQNWQVYKHVTVSYQRKRVWKNDGTLGWEYSNENFSNEINGSDAVELPEYKIPQLAGKISQIDIHYNHPTAPQPGKFDSTVVPKDTFYAGLKGLVYYDVSYDNVYQAELSYWDDTDKKDITSVDNTVATGREKDKIIFDDSTLQQLSDKYEFLYYSSGSEKFTDKDRFGKFVKASEPLKFVAHFAHKKQPTYENKKVFETIYYVDANDTSKQLAPSHTSSVEFIRKGSKDLVTGATSDWGNWTPGKATFAEVKSPTIDGYTPDQASIGTQEVKGDSNGIYFSVKYTKKDESIPWTSLTPAEKPDDPDSIPWTPIIIPDNTSDEKPDETTPETPAKDTHQDEKSESKANNKTTSTSKKAINISNPAQQARKQQTSNLPQTGANSLAALLGISLLGFSSLLGAASLKRKH
jgi:LPXTG-motif cell wall-anchored protein